MGGGFHWVRSVIFQFLSVEQKFTAIALALRADFAYSPDVRGSSGLHGAVYRRRWIEYGRISSPTGYRTPCRAGSIVRCRQRCGLCLPAGESLYWMCGTRRRVAGRRDLDALCLSALRSRDDPENACWSARFRSTQKMGSFISRTRIH